MMNGNKGYELTRRASTPTSSPKPFCHFFWVAADCDRQGAIPDYSRIPVATGMPVNVPHFRKI
jgi:hypothetical protein